MKFYKKPLDYKIGILYNGKLGDIIDICVSAMNKNVFFGPFSYNPDQFKYWFSHTKSFPFFFSFSLDSNAYNHYCRLCRNLKFSSSDITRGMRAFVQVPDIHLEVGTGNISLHLTTNPAWWQQSDMKSTSGSKKYGNKRLLDFVFLSLGPSSTLFFHYTTLSGLLWTKKNPDIQIFHRFV